MKKKAKRRMADVCDDDPVKYQITMILGSYEKEDRAKILECCHDNIIDRADDDKVAHELLNAAADDAWLVDAERITELLGVNG
jgi:hypothetical protein